MSSDGHAGEGGVHKVPALYKALCGATENAMIQEISHCKKLAEVATGWS